MLPLVVMPAFKVMPRLLVLAACLCQALEGLDESRDGPQLVLCRTAGALIEQLLCQLTARLDPDLLDEELTARLSDFTSLGIVERTGDRLVITDRGRPYARNIAAAFDRHAQADKSVGNLS